MAQTLSKKNSDKNLHILADVKKEIKKTKEFNNFLEKNKLINALIISDNSSLKNITKSARNIKNVKLIKDEGTNIYDMYKTTEDFISEAYVIDPNMNTILFKLNRIYELNEMDTLINEKIPNSKFKFSSLDFISNDCSKTFRYFFTRCVCI